MIRPLLAFAAIALVATPALADRKPTDREARRIAFVLKATGYTSWKAIKLDGSGAAAMWEVDDAVRADGSKWDLRLRPQSLRIASRELDRKAPPKPPVTVPAQPKAGG